MSGCFDKYFTGHQKYHAEYGMCSIRQIFTCSFESRIIFTSLMLSYHFNYIVVKIKGDDYLMIVRQYLRFRIHSLRSSLGRWRMTWSSCFRRSPKYPKSIHMRTGRNSDMSYQKIKITSCRSSDEGHHRHFILGDSSDGGSCNIQTLDHTYVRNN